jgi:hypothetical protein
MTRIVNFRRFIDGLWAPAVYIAIFAVGLRYSFYETFSQFRWWDDEGTMMLRVAELLRDSGAQAAIAGVYGPFYYLHKYAIYTVLNAGVSHDINRLTTIVLWGLVATGSAVYVHRLSRSILLAAVVQMQLILHLRAFADEPGHPHEIALILIVLALLCSSYVSRPRGRLASMLGIGLATGALLLVKVNLGAYLGIAFALAVLLSMPRSVLVLILRWTSAAVAVALPAAVMWRHLDLPWARNYCVLATSAIASSVVIATGDRHPDGLRWPHLGAGVAGGVLAVLAVGGVLAWWGQSLVELIAILLSSAANFPSLFIIPAPIGETVTRVSAVSVLLACLYLATARRLVDNDPSRAVLAICKLAYGCHTFYQLYHLGPGLLLLELPVPFLWLVLVRTDSTLTIGQRFSRVFLCLLAALQTLQAYPVHGSQATWAVFLFAPLAAVCVNDALRTLAEISVRCLRWNARWTLPGWLTASLMVPVLVAAGWSYYAKANVEGLATVYQEQAALDLPGATLLRLPGHEVVRIRWLVDRMAAARCDTFIGKPGFASLYFWTRIPPPAPIGNAWILFMREDQQQAIVDKMEAHERPCVIHNPGLVSFWATDQSTNFEGPLFRYIDTQFTQVDEFGGYAFFVRKRRS